MQWPVSQHTGQNAIYYLTTSIIMFHSSPIRGTALEEIEQSQQNRAARFYRPMSSPVKKTTKRERARHTMEEIRSLHRQARLALGREKVTDTEDYNKQIEELRAQADALELDPDFLVEEEREDYQEEYEAQLEDFLVDEELELEQQLMDLQLEEKSEEGENREEGERKEGGEK